MPFRRTLLWKISVTAPSASAAPVFRIEPIQSNSRMNSKMPFGKRSPRLWLTRKAYSSRSTHLLPEPPDFTERLTHELSIPSNETQTHYEQTQSHTPDVALGRGF